MDVAVSTSATCAPAPSCQSPEVALRPAEHAAPAVPPPPPAAAAPPGAAPALILASGRVSMPSRERPLAPGAAAGPPAPASPGAWEPPAERCGAAEPPPSLPGLWAGSGPCGKPRPCRAPLPMHPASLKPR